MLRFRNLVSRLNLLEEEYSVAYDDVAADRTSSSGTADAAAAPPVHGPARVVYRLSGTATFHTLFGLRNFPLDSQTFGVCPGVACLCVLCLPLLRALVFSCSYACSIPFLPQRWRS